ncbi:hypothetical protein [Calidifontibacter terrae]
MNIDETISAAYGAHPFEVARLERDLLALIHTHYDADVVARAHDALAQMRTKVAK